MKNKLSLSIFILAYPKLVLFTSHLFAHFIEENELLGTVNLYQSIQLFAAHLSR